MKYSYLIVGIVIVGVFLWYLNSSSSIPPLGASLSGTTVTVFKTQTCGCCGNYVSYLRRQGVNVKVQDLQDISKIKQKYGVPSELQSCHTTIIGEYVVEGHMPMEAVQKLLTEKPDIKGITLPGMPSASPGMPGSKTAPFEVYAIQKDGSTNVFMEI